ncbi:grasp-with-spasm system ATP-grasp peptide maturase [Chryseobacterium angstadtii]|uniref:grasp-with-spasm system ATP-grasp peptide maturase n=1 Tax=Chryseobacterium angstadtii TaxID=558151 RepID=UPI000A0748F5|nr:grasp-with-spasm system ATP-grasp peptide maturase [Chryseobacterium angstadtii]
MILIQSDITDASTNDVMDWIFFMEKEQQVKRINNETVVQNMSFKISDADGFSAKVSTDQGDLDSTGIQKFWYRRGNFSSKTLTYSIHDIELKNLLLKLQGNFQRENERMIDNIYTAMESGNKINSFHENFTNKIHNLSYARNAGLKIPETLVTNSFDELLDFAMRHDFIITKDIEFNAFRFSFGEQSQVHIHQPVVKLSRKDIENQSIKNKGKYFGHFSMYQQYTAKKYELRIFFLNGKLYTMAIFSQANEKTQTDFRNYDAERPNRCVQYQLPKETEMKLTTFMESIDMNCGSIDMIYTPEKEYVFLEVNPVGQFQWLSKNCNYDIERQIAMDLLKEKR